VPSRIAPISFSSQKVAQRADLGSRRARARREPWNGRRLLVRVNTPRYFAFERAPQAIRTMWSLPVRIRGGGRAGLIDCQALFRW